MFEKSPSSLRSGVLPTSAFAVRPIGPPSFPVPPPPSSAPVKQTLQNFTLDMVFLQILCAHPPFVVFSSGTSQLTANACQSTSTSPPSHRRFGFRSLSSPVRFPPASTRSFSRLGRRSLSSRKSGSPWTLCCARAGGQSPLPGCLSELG